jgi:hypothetical protein
VSSNADAAPGVTTAALAEVMPPTGCGAGEAPVGGLLLRRIRRQANAGRLLLEKLLKEQPIKTEFALFLSAVLHRV